MVARQVREDERLEGDAGRALERQRVRGGLHDTRQVTAGDHLAKQPLQLERVGGGELRGPLDPGDAVDHGAQQGGTQTRRREDRRQQVRGRRLAVGAGHGGDPQLAARVAVEARRHEGHGVTRSWHQDLGDGQIGSARSQTRATAPAATAWAAIVVTVGLESGDAKEQRSGNDGAGVALASAPISTSGSPSIRLRSSPAARAATFMLADDSRSRRAGTRRAASRRFHGAISRRCRA